MNNTEGTAVDVGCSADDDVDDPIPQDALDGNNSNNTVNDAVPVGIRYTPANATQAVERCIALLALQDQSTVTVTDAIIATLDKVDLDKMRLVAQGYDGASVMSGSRRGVQALLSERLDVKSRIFTA